MEQKYLAAIVVFSVLALALIPSGDCERNRRQSGDCQYLCPSNYQPVCAQLGRSQRTFSNNCVFGNERCRNSNWRYLYLGECGRRNPNQNPPTELPIYIQY